MIWAIHGNLGQPDDWDAFREADPGAEVEAVHLWLNEVHDFDHWANWLCDFAAGIDPNPVLLGYSLGGRMAMHALLKRPALWKAAIFVSANPGLSSSVERRARQMRDAVWASRLRDEPVANFLHAWNDQDVFDADQASDEQEHLVTEHRLNIADAFERWSLGIQEDLRGPLRECCVPQHWVGGSWDPKFAGIAHEMGTSGDHASYQLVDECGHRVLLHKPLELAECVRNFLKHHVDTSS